jgi:hypothetical protein
VQTVWCLGHGTNSNSLVHTTTTCMLTWFQSRQSQIEAPMQLNGIKSLEYFQSETVQLGFWRINSISLHPFLITTYLHVLDQSGNRNKVTQVPRSHRNRLLYPTYQSKLTTHSIESEWWPTFLWSAKPHTTKHTSQSVFTKHPRSRRESATKSDPISDPPTWMDTETKNPEG